MSRAGRARRGLTYLEVQAAFAALGVVLAGLAPAVVSQLRLMAAIDRRFPEGTHYLVPAGDPWASKLGADATIEASDTYAPAPAGPEPDNDVELVPGSAAGSAAADMMSVEVIVTPAGGP